MESPVDTVLQTQVHFEELPPLVWQKALPSFLTPGNVEVWRFNLNTYLHHMENFHDLLESGEKARSARLLIEKDRQISIAARALLRILLGKYLNVNPRAISFTYSERMKPKVKNECNLSIHFNVSHSGPCILIAVSNEEVGIDVEYCDKAYPIKTDMDYLFSAAEKFFINNQHSPIEAYHLLWTRKEALLKGTSQGIIDKIKFVPCLNGTHQINTGVIDSCMDWSVYSFGADKFCIASVAYKGRNKKLTFNELNEIT